MNTAIGSLVTLLALTLAAPAQDIQFNFDAAANFERYRTYKWIELPGSVQLDDLLARQLTSALEAGLAKKGLRKVDTDTADLYIGWVAASSQERRVDVYGTPAYGFGPRWGGGMASATTSTLTIGSIALDMYDVSAKHLVWRGVATKTVEPNIKPDQRHKNIEKGVEKLLKNYPPKNT